MAVSFQLPVQFPHSEIHLVLSCNEREVLAFLFACLFVCLSIAHLVAAFECGELTDEPPGGTQLRPHKYMMGQETCMLQLRTCSQAWVSRRTWPATRETAGHDRWRWLKPIASHGAMDIAFLPYVLSIPHAPGRWRRFGQRIQTCRHCIARKKHFKAATAIVVDTSQMLRGIYALFNRGQS